MSSVAKRLAELGVDLPPCPAPVASYLPGVAVGNLVFVSGQLPVEDGALLYSGRVGETVTVEEGYEAARLCAIRCLSALQAVVPDLDQVERIAKVTGYVSCANGFTDQPQVINGASDLLQAVFGEKGQHARAAVGVSGLPLGAPVEVELVAYVKGHTGCCS